MEGVRPFIEEQLVSAVSLARKQSVLCRHCWPIQAHSVKILLFVGSESDQRSRARTSPWHERSHHLLPARSSTQLRRRYHPACMWALGGVAKPSLRLTPKTRRQAPGRLQVACGRAQRRDQPHMRQQTKNKAILMTKKQAQFHRWSSGSVIVGTTTSNAERAQQLPQTTTASNLGPTKSERKRDTCQEKGGNNANTSLASLQVPDYTQGPLTPKTQWHWGAQEKERISGEFPPFKKSVLLLSKFSSTNLCKFQEKYRVFQIFSKKTLNRMRLLVCKQNTLYSMIMTNHNHTGTKRSALEVCPSTIYVTHLTNTLYFLWCHPDAKICFNFSSVKRVIESEPCQKKARPSCKFFIWII